MSKLHVIVIFLLFLNTVSFRGVQSQENKFIYTRIIDVSPSVSSYVVTDILTNESDYYTSHTFYLTGEYLNSKNAKYPVTEFHCFRQSYFLFNLVEKISSISFIVPSVLPGFDFTCTRTATVFYLTPGITQVTGQIDLYTRGNTSVFGDGSYSFNLALFGNFEDIEQTNTTIIIQDGQIQSYISALPSIWEDYISTNSDDIDQSPNSIDNSVGFSFPFNLILFVSIILTSVIKNTKKFID